MNEDTYAVEVCLEGDMSFEDIKDLVRSERVIGYTRTLIEYDDLFCTLAENYDSVEEDLERQGIEHSSSELTEESFNSWYNDLVDDEEQKAMVAAD